MSFVLFDYSKIFVLRTVNWGNVVKMFLNGSSLCHMQFTIHSEPELCMLPLNESWEKLFIY